MLGVTFDIMSYTSNHFELMLTLCEQMIKEGKAFVDDTDGETMKQERSDRVISKHRDNGKMIHHTFLVVQLYINYYIMSTANANTAAAVCCVALCIL